MKNINVYTSSKDEIHKYIKYLKNRICCLGKISLTITASELLSETVPPCPINIKLSLNGVVFTPYVIIGDGITPWTDYLADINTYFLGTGFIFTIVNNQLTATSTSVNRDDVWDLVVEIVCE